ncbi:sensor histidine kinase [Brevibacillus sp. B_LB10_24]|uniref:sensor histidine kinase n=1 Tax=Brevibacillus sp. B_LB10_24 TaxID=3380645 RepID=UPI0038BD7E90
MKRLERVKRTAGIISIILYSVLCLAAAYFLTTYIIARFGFHPSDFSKQLSTSVLGSVFFMLSIWIIGTIMRPRQTAFFMIFIDALRRIAKGDFNVKVQVDQGRNDPFSQLAESINHMAVQLSELEQMRQEFISNVSHEIQSPLTSISGFALALQNDELTPEERKHYLGIIETECKRLSKLSENLLKLTSLESEHHPFEPKPYRLDRQLRKLVLACEPQWTEKALEMDISLAEITVTADEELLSQVWVNLISNSIKFTPNGGEISIQLARSGSEAIVRISDTGSGIAPEDQEHIFERFYKADKSRNRTVGGSGLGLSIAKKIVEMHKGEIYVQSSLGQGTSFTVCLPVNPASDLER